MFESGDRLYRSFPANRYIREEHSGHLVSTSLKPIMPRSCSRHLLYLTSKPHTDYIINGSESGQADIELNHATVFNTAGRDGAFQNLTSDLTLKTNVRISLWFWWVKLKIAKKTRLSNSLFKERSKLLKMLLLVCRLHHSAFSLYTKCKCADTNLDNVITSVLHVNSPAQNKKMERNSTFVDLVKEEIRMCAQTPARLKKCS